MSAPLIKQFGTVPIHTHILKSDLEDYKAPMARIARLQKKGQLLNLRRDLYICLPEEGSPSRELIANHLLHPSYVSYETVLSSKGVIPERVHTTKSACMKRNKVFENATGRYEYLHVSDAYFPIGLIKQTTNEGYCYISASTEKALCDLIISFPNLRIQSVKAMRFYLENYLKTDWNIISNMDTSIIRACAETTNKKKNELKLLEKAICYERG